MSPHVLVLAKAPRPGHVKTRLCPPCTPHQAAAVALAALQDTLDAVDEAPADRLGRRTLVLEGAPDVLVEQTTVDGAGWPRDGWHLSRQRGTSLGERIAHAFADNAVDDQPSVLIGMDTPQVTGTLITRCLDRLADADAVLGMAADGGWWLLALRDPSCAAVLATVPTSRSDTGARTRAALSGAGLSVAMAPVLRDVDTAADARQVAARCGPGRRFPAAVTRHVPTTQRSAGRWPAGAQA